MKLYCVVKSVHKYLKLYNSSAMAHHSNYANYLTAVWCRFELKLIFTASQLATTCVHVGEKRKSKRMKIVKMAAFGRATGYYTYAMVVQTIQCSSTALIKTIIAEICVR